MNATTEKIFQDYVSMSVLVSESFFTTSNSSDETADIMLEFYAKNGKVPFYSMSFEAYDVNTVRQKIRAEFPKAVTGSICQYPKGGNSVTIYYQKK